MESETVKKLGPIIIESLGASDKKTGEIFHTEILKYKTFENPNLTSRLIVADTKESFLNALSEIVRSIREERFFPILHIESHGCDDGLYLGSKETVTWSEMMPLFVEINTLLHNRFIVSLGACYGINFLSAIDITKRAPFRCVIATTQAIKETNLIEAFEAYFDSYYFTFDIIESVKRMNSAIGSDMFFHVSQEYCFDRITDPDMNPSRFKDNIKKIATEQYTLNPELRNQSFKSLLSQTEDKARAGLREARKNRPVFCFEDFKEKAKDLSGQ